MKKYSTVIVDDDLVSVELLKADCLRHRELDVVCATSSPMYALNAIEALRPDILFLDMEMSDLSGLELLRRLHDHGTYPPKMRVVFYTAYDKYMIDAIRNAAFDYLLKPYKTEEFDSIVERLVNTPQSCEENYFNEYELQLKKLLATEERFTLQSITGLLILHHSQVVCFQYVDSLRCWQVMLSDLQQHRLRTSTKSQHIIDINSNFRQVSNNCIINVEYLASIENQTLKCHMYPPFNNLDISISRHYYNALKNSLERM